MGMKITMRPTYVRKRAARPKPKPSGSEPCFHTIAPRLEGAIMEAILWQDLKDNDRIYSSIGFLEGEPPQDNPYACMFAFMWQASEQHRILTECMYEIENPPDV